MKIILINPLERMHINILRDNTCFIFAWMSGTNDSITGYVSEMDFYNNSIHVRTGQFNSWKWCPISYKWMSKFIDFLGFPLIIPFEGYKNHGVCLVYISSPKGNWLREPYNTSRICLKNILINLTWNRAEKDKTSFIWTITESCWPKDLWKRKMERFQGSSF